MNWVFLIFQTFILLLSLIAIVKGIKTTDAYLLSLGSILLNCYLFTEIYYTKGVKKNAKYKHNCISK